MAIKKIGYREVDVTTAIIDTSEIQSRQDNINANIDDLVQSIKLQGLFSPILLIELEDGKYELIAGQRRKKAYEQLIKEFPDKFKNIPAFIYENTMENWEKRQFQSMKTLIKNP